LDFLDKKAAPSTVHWDSNAANGRLIGWTVRVAGPVGSPWEWLSGRVVLYDPFTHKHKIQWQMDNHMQDDNIHNNNNHQNNNNTLANSATAAASTNTAAIAKSPKKLSAAAAANKKKKPPVPSSSWIWLRNEEHNLHIATRLVWAHVKGYAWWPALVREANTDDTTYPSSSDNGNATGFGNNAVRSVQVEFFFTNEVANLRDTSEQ
jgi:hypothetical protein